MIALSLLFLACPAPDDTKANDTGPRDDSGPIDTGEPDSGDPETGDTGTTPGLDCGELVNPWPVASGEDAWTAAGLAGPPIVYLTSFDSAALDWANFSAGVYGCPTVTEDDATGTVIISGTCDNDLGAMSGTATFVTSPGGDYTATYDAFTLEDENSGLVYAADGSWGYDAGFSSAFLDLAIGYDYAYDGDSDDWGSIAWALAISVTDDFHMEGRVDVTESPEGTGSFCIVLDEFDDSGTCTEESTSTYAIQGSAYAVLVFDPDAEPRATGAPR